ncbi:VAN3-binding -like, partial [Olea europaea subsp. europaea]
MEFVSKSPSLLPNSSFNIKAGNMSTAEEQQHSANLTFSSATSQLLLQRIMSQLELSPLTSGRLSHSSGTLNGCLTEENDSPPISPTEDFEDIVK